MDSLSAIRVRVLGPIAVELDGRAVELGPPLQRTVLGVLALTTPRPVGVGVLAAAVWGDDEPRTATHSLQTYVSGLRSILGRDLLETTGGGYRLCLDPDGVDAVRFERLVEAAGAARERGAPSVALATVEQALALWQDLPLAGAPDSAWLTAERSRLQELHLRACATWAAASLDLGRSEELVPTLERLTRQFPLEERLWQHLLLALHRSGRSAAALQAYERLRRGLVEELGVDPSPALVRLHAAILRGDPGLAPPALLRSQAPDAGTRNPYKALDHFTEADAVDFIGREGLVSEVAQRLTVGDGRLLVLFGPSGCGTSSLVHAGLLPALRAEAMTGPADRRLKVVAVRPGSAPIAAITGAVAGAAHPSDPGAVPEDRWLLDVLAELGQDVTVILVLDQFEEVFGPLDDPGECDRLLGGLTLAVEAADVDLRLVIVLRTDHLDRFLSHRSVSAGGPPVLIPVLPLTANQLAQAAVAPAGRVGIDLEPALVTTLVADVVGQPGGLPFFQFTLHELVARRTSDTLTLASYDAVGGVHGAVTRRAEELFDQLGLREQEAARQVFLRLVHVGEGPDGDLRRRATLDELVSLPVGSSELQTVLDVFGGGRLLRFDRDAVSGAPTVEFAHDALLAAWDRLVAYVSDARGELQERSALARAAFEWQRSGEHPDYLLTGARLDHYLTWAGSTGLMLTGPEQRYLELSRAHPHAARHTGLSGAHPSIAVVLAVLLLAMVLGSVNLGVEEPGTSVALVHRDDGTLFDRAMVLGLERLVGELPVATTVVAPQSDPAGDIRRLCRTGVDLLFLGDLSFASDAIAAADDCPDTGLLVVDAPELWATAQLPANVRPLEFADEQGAFLAGAAAAMASETHQIAFLAATPIPAIETYRAGFLAGAMRVDPTTRMTTSFLAGTDEEEVVAAFTDERLAERAAQGLFEAGNDVILVVAGDAGLGVLDAAAAVPGDGPTLWVIGVDVDWEVSQPLRRTRHVLASIVKEVGVAMAEVVARHLDGTLDDELPRFGLDEGALRLSHRSSGDHGVDWGRIDALRDDIIAGRIVVPHSPR
jgi:DNA-binding SARP family transcriptional activator/basic membrane lipoprotein Med (substrate-binding protein (PBP1-ABC) superfamily)